MEALRAGQLPTGRLADASLVVGGGITLYLWREELLALALRLQRYLSGLAAHLHRRAEPVVVVATQAVEEMPVPVMPGVDGAGQ